MTNTERAELLWMRYGRICRNRIYLAGEYIGRIGTDDGGQPFTFCKGDRGIGFMGVAPVAVVTQHISR